MNEISSIVRASLRRFLADYGMVFVLILICGIFTWLTIAEQRPVGAAAARDVAEQFSSRSHPSKSGVLIVTGTSQDDQEFANEIASIYKSYGHSILAVVRGGPTDAKAALDKLRVSGERIDVLISSEAAAGWSVLDEARAKSVSLSPGHYQWPNFLKRDNLLNVANQIAVIAIIAVGMTLVIITGGIDLSVGSLLALSAVVCTLGIQEWAGGVRATPLAMTFCALLAIGACAAAGAFSGLMIVSFAIPPFIATLAMMLVASGAAFLLARGQSIYLVPDSFVWLGRGDTIGIPNAVLLMLALYVAAHVFMKRHVMGRYIYAVGGNDVAARLSGVPVKRTLLFAYASAGALAGLGGVVMASQLKSGSPTYGQMYELYVIAAVVVGGASLSGGRGKIFGTLIGALIIAVIQNGMNLTGVESYTQKVALGLVILGAVLLDRLRHRRELA